MTEKREQELVRMEFKGACRELQELYEEIAKVILDQSSDLRHLADWIFSDDIVNVATGFLKKQQKVHKRIHMHQLREVELTAKAKRLLYELLGETSDEE